MIKFVEHKFIKENSIEYRDYQVRLAKIALSSNTLIVLPTGLGKTTIALLIIADMLTTNTKRILLMAPTRVLIHQHYKFLREHLKISDIGLITGEIDRSKRKEIWNNTIICATPQVVQNDLEGYIVRPEDLSLVIFDEVHKAVGNHPYAVIARLIKGYSRIVGLTATLPSEKEKVREIMDNLSIARLEYRDEYSPDVRPYIHDIKIDYIEVELPLVIKKIRDHINNAIEKRITLLKRDKIVTKASISELLQIRESELIKNNKDIARLVFSTIRLYHALNILDTQSIRAFVKFCERLKEKKGLGIYDILNDKDFIYAYEIARGALISKIEHPKISKLIEIIEKEEGKILIFTSYRDNVEALYEMLNSKFSVGYLIGKAGEKGLNEKEQVNVVEAFREGKIKVLIATRVGEEGLDISECKLVVFYDNVPSAIRFIQRRGRTGRKSEGRVIVLVTKDTLDETYSFISRRKVRTVKSVINRINRMGRGILDYL